MKDRDRLRLLHILDAAEKIASYLSGVDRNGFASNRMLLFSAQVRATLPGSG